jgi:reverse gyrase
MNIITQLEEDIRKLVRPLKEENEILEVLKRRLTKKEFKYYQMRLKNNNESQMLKELKCDKERLEEIIKSTILKVNQEKIKNELMA